MSVPDVHTANEENIGPAFEDAAAEFLSRFETAECPYCGYDAYVAPSGRILCSCWCENLMSELCEEVQQMSAASAHVLCNCMSDDLTALGPCEAQTVTM